TRSGASAGRSPDANSTDAAAPGSAAAEGVAAPAAEPAGSESAMQTRLTAALRQIERELISDDPITADLRILIKAIAEQPIERIRQLPTAAQKALSMLHGDAPTSALVKLFEQNPAMSQALLQQVNSAHYNPTGARIVSLTDAINRMGRAGVQCVVMEQSVAGMVSRPGGQLDAMVQQVWNHMVRVAPLARRLAPAFAANADQSFLIG